MKTVTTIVLGTLLGVFSPSLFAKDVEKTVNESTILYKLKKNVKASELKKLNALVNKNTIIEKKEIKGINVKVAKLKNIKGSEAAFSKALMETGAVEYALPDAIIKPQATFADDTDNQWHHNMINSSTAWDYTTGPSDLDTVKVCILDTGVDTDHPDLIDNILLPGYNAYFGEEGNIEDVWGHGTTTAGVIGAVGNNGIGVSGIAWNINILPVQISMGGFSSSASLSTMVNGLTWCADQGAKVANLSYDVAQYAVINDAAQYLRDKGGILFVAAGNSGTNYDLGTYPDYGSFVTVGATDQTDTKSSFSSYGAYVDVVAPGSSIYTTKIGGYTYATGSSYSSPMVAGLAALIYSLNPEFTPAQVESYIFHTAADLGTAGNDNMYGQGRIDAGSAIIHANDGYTWSNILPVAVASADKISGIAPLVVTFNGNDSIDEDGAIISYQWDFGDGSSANGSEYSHVYNNIGTYNVTLTVTDTDSEQSTSIPISIEVAPDLNALNAPSELSAVLEGNNIMLNWNNNTNYDVDFDIYRSKRIKGKYNFELIDTVTMNATAYTDRNIASGSYKYKVQTRVTYKGENFSSEFSDEVAIRVKKVTGK